MVRVSYARKLYSKMTKTAHPKRARFDDPFLEAFIALNLLKQSVGGRHTNLLNLLRSESQWLASKNDSGKLFKRVKRELQKKRGVMMNKLQKKLLHRKALRVRQNGGRFVFLLSLRGEELLHLASVSRVSRDDHGKLIGYQRKEVKSSAVQEIADYLNATDMLLAHPSHRDLIPGPNVKFVSSRGQTCLRMALASALGI